MNILFEQISIEQKDEVLTLFKEAAEVIAKLNVDHWQYWKNPPIEKVQWMEEGIKNNEFFFTKNEDGERLGMVRIMDEDLLYWGEREGKAKYIHSLVVKEEFKGQGIGKLVVEQVANLAREAGCEFLRLDCDSKNPNLPAYYESQGFEQVGEVKLPLSIYNLYERRL